jgi:hypothetical protein
MIIKVGESVPLDRSNNPTTDHSKTLANLGSRDTGPCRHAALQCPCVGVIDGVNVFAEWGRQVLA